MTELEIIDDDSDLIEELLPPWKILVVDDDDAVHQMTDFVLKGHNFFGKKLDIISAYSAAAALEVLKNDNDIALALIDVVMESEKAGFTLVKQIRDALHNHHIRLIIRTGQPGFSSEEDISKEYEIHGYFLKTEITSEKLKAIVHTALRSYQDIIELEYKNQQLKQLSFDIREALNGLHGSVQIANKTQDPEKQKNALSKASSFSKKLIDMINEKLEKLGN